VFKLANWIQSSEPSAIQQAIGLSLNPDFISFALGLPALELMPLELLNQNITSVIYDSKFLQYSPPSSQLKKHIVDLMLERGVQCNESQIFLTAGAQQAMSLLTRLLLNQGDTVAVEELAYTGFIQAIQPLHPKTLIVPTNYEDGIDITALELALNQGVQPALLYIVTNGHNPLGLSLSEKKKIDLVNLIKQFKVPVIEDDTYGFLYYEQPLLPLRALDAERIIYIGSFSKSVIPTLRVGWIVAPEELISKLSIIKEATDINTTTFTQGLISSFIEGDGFEKHLLMLRYEYKKRRDKMLQCLKEYFPKDTNYFTPNNGVFIWVKLPKGLNSQTLLEFAVNEKVAFFPGNAFAISNNKIAEDCMRLNFSFCDENKIEEGIKRLARAINIMSCSK
jgi:2-aminoadipate transaminase